MTVRQITVGSLKQLKNAVIGNPSAKLSLARDSAFIHLLVSCLNHPATPSTCEAQGSQDDIRIEAVHIISSLAYGSETALSGLLRANAHQEVVRALTSPHALGTPQLKAALARGLRVLASSMADVVGPSQGPMRTYTPEHRAEAKIALNFLFEYECLDVYLPLLEDSSLQTSLSIAQLIGAAVRTDTHRTAIIEWLPPQERQKEIKNRRGWEKHDVVYQATNGRHGAWVLRHLVAMVQKKDSKVQEAALSSLGALAMDNPSVANILTKTPLEAPVPALNLVLTHAKSRVTSVQLAASSCATHIIRAQGNHYPGHLDHTAVLTVIHVVNRILSSASEQPQSQIKACYTLYSLVRDEKDFCVEAADQGVLASLASLVKSITPIENSDGWEIDEPDSRVSLREAALKAIAAISLFDKVIKREVADTYDLIPIIQACLTDKNVGVRCSACHCLRSLSRDTAVIKTNITDSGAGMTLYQVFKKEDEDVRVIAASLATVCNLVNDFSPLRKVMLEDGLLPRLMQLFGMEDQEIRVSVLWAIKNLLAKSQSSTKDMVMQHLGWSQLPDLANDSDPEIQEQAFAILRNLTDDETGVSLVFESMGGDTLANCLSAGLDSPHELVTRETTYVLGNIANSARSQQDLMFTHPHILDGIHHCLADARPGTRVPLVGCLLTLLRTNPRRKRDLVEAGFVSTLRHLCERTGGGGSGGGISVGGSGSLAMSTSPVGPRHHMHLYHLHHPHRHMICPEDDREAAVLAKQVLDLMDPSTIGEML
ncbi:ARM repeat-containing protein [Pisolithus orientalis]|uniref:ARM repeat-containing protein n=1 Tax=Pisolithus orientalis TaxID=936130 RepID=UPI002225556C|nr:ARM repeat-containing protein [Pisolithus orientalis]KAI5990570.1 ARM repeat-containing protein [Pisolithus orientalis]